MLLPPRNASQAETTQQNDPLFMELTEQSNRLTEFIHRQSNSTSLVTPSLPRLDLVQAFAGCLAPVERELVVTMLNMSQSTLMSWNNADYLQETVNTTNTFRNNGNNYERERSDIQLKSKEWWSVAQEISADNSTTQQNSSQLSELVQSAVNIPHIRQHFALALARMPHRISEVEHWYTNRIDINTTPRGSLFNLQNSSPFLWNSASLDTLSSSSDTTGKIGDDIALSSNSTNHLDEYVPQLKTEPEPETFSDGQLPSTQKRKYRRKHQAVNSSKLKIETNDDEHEYFSDSNSVDTLQHGRQTKAQKKSSSSGSISIISTTSSGRRLNRSRPIMTCDWPGCGREICGGNSKLKRHQKVHQKESQPVRCEELDCDALLKNADELRKHRLDHAASKKASLTKKQGPKDQQQQQQQQHSHFLRQVSGKSSLNEDEDEEFEPHPDPEEDDDNDYNDT